MNCFRGPIYVERQLGVTSLFFPHVVSLPEAFLFKGLTVYFKEDCGLLSYPIFNL